MIKRVYPRMSTADFVARSIAIHGDLYDYSESVYQGLKEPFSFGCKRCGTTRTLSQAGTHIRKNKPCGCKPCSSDKLSPCKVCGVAVSSKVYHKQTKRCKACCDQSKLDRAKRIEEKHGKNCRACGTWFVRKDRFFCSAECRKSVVAKPFEFACSNCKKQSVRDPHKVKNPSLTFCSKECHKAFQKNNNSLYQTNGRIVDWTEKSKKAKERWIRIKKREKAKTEKGSWFAKCLKETTKSELPVGSWKKRCVAAVSSLSDRWLGEFRLKSIKIVGSWDRRIQLERPRLNQKRRSKWKQRCETASRNMRRREAIARSARQQQIN